MSASVEDDLEFNPFYLALQNNFQVLYQEAQQKCHLICIPHSEVLAGQTIDRNFVYMHILKPSPFFRGSYVTTDKENSKSLVIEHGNLKTADGFTEERTLRILADETGYNKEMRPYKILLLDTTIWPLPHVYVRSLSEGIQGHKMFKWTLAENETFLKSHSEHNKVLVELDKNIRLFNDNYMVLQKYLSDAAAKLEDMWHRVKEDFASASYIPSHLNSRYYRQLDIALESHIICGVHNKMFPVISQACARDDRALKEKCLIIHQVPPEKIGANSKYLCQQDAAVEEMQKLEYLISPVEKLFCMKETLDIISQTVEQNLKKRTFLGKKKVCLASDDLIPLLVIVISQAKNLQLFAHLRHIELCHWSTSTLDDLSYSQVTFRAAVQYIISTDFDRLLINTKSVSQIEPKDDVESSVLLQKTNPTELTSYPAMASRHDKDLDRITKMLDTNLLSNPVLSISSKDDNTRTHMGQAHINKPIHKKNSGLGEFLSSLKEDGLYTKYGKQT